MATCKPAMTLPLFVQLFGPVQNEGSLVTSIGPTWQWPGAATTASTKTFEFQLGFPIPVWVRWIVLWRTQTVNQYVRLVHADDGPSNITQIAQIQGTGRGEPDDSVMNVTVPFQTLVAAGQHKHLGWQLWGDGNPIQIYEVRLEIGWQVSS